MVECKYPRQLKSQRRIYSAASATETPACPFSAAPSVPRPLSQLIQKEPKIMTVKKRSPLWCWRCLWRISPALNGHKRRRTAPPGARVSLRPAPPSFALTRYRSSAPGASAKPVSGRERARRNRYPACTSDPLTRKWPRSCAPARDPSLFRSCFENATRAANTFR